MFWIILTIILVSLLSIPILIAYGIHVYDKCNSETDKKESK